MRNKPSVRPATTHSFSLAVNRPFLGILGDLQWGGAHLGLPEGGGISLVLEMFVQVQQNSEK